MRGEETRREDRGGNDGMKEGRWQRKKRKQGEEMR